MTIWGGQRDGPLGINSRRWAGAPPAPCPGSFSGRKFAMNAGARLNVEDGLSMHGGSHVKDGTTYRPFCL